MACWYTIFCNQISLFDGGAYQLSNALNLCVDIEWNESHTNPHLNSFIHFWCNLKQFNWQQSVGRHFRNIVQKGWYSIGKPSINDFILFSLNLLAFCLHHQAEMTASSSTAACDETASERNNVISITHALVCECAFTFCISYVHIHVLLCISSVHLWYENHTNLIPHQSRQAAGWLVLEMFYFAQKTRAYKQRNLWNKENFAETNEFTRHKTRML